MIPVLFLAPLERRFFETSPSDGQGGPAFDLLILSSFVAGEIVALGVLVEGKPGKSTLTMVVIPLVLGGLALVGPIASPRVRILYENLPESQPRRAIGFLELTILFLLTLGLPLGVLLLVLVHSI